MSHQYSKYIDHTNLSPTASAEDIKKLCEEAIQYQFKSVCIHPSYITLAKQYLHGSNVLVCTVIGFPLGQNTTATKAFETQNAVQLGADEIDMVINISHLKSQQTQACINEINAVVEAAQTKPVKVIVETCLLTEAEKLAAVKLVSASHAQFIKTSTGFSTAGAQLADIKLWKQYLVEHHSQLKIKAAGGVKTPADLAQFIQAGADRIGTSKGVALMGDQSSNAGY